MASKLDLTPKKYICRVATDKGVVYLPVKGVEGLNLEARTKTALRIQHPTHTWESLEAVQDLETMSPQMREFFGIGDPEEMNPLNVLLVKAARCGDKQAIQMTTQLLGKLKIADLTDDEATQLGEIRKRYSPV